MSDPQRPIILVDCSAGPSQEKNAELGAGRAQGFAIATVVDPLTKRITETREGFLEPRSIHVSKVDAPDPSFPNLLDRRFAPALQSDLEHGFGSPVTVDDPCVPFKNDWDHKNKSTRWVGGEDPRGKTGLTPQIACVFDVPGGYSLAFPIGPTIAAKDGSSIPAGFFVGKPAPASGGTQERTAGAPKLNTLPLSTFFYADPDQTDVGGDGTPVSRLGMKVDAYVGDKDTQRYGPESFETSDWPSIDTPSGSTQKLEVKRTFDKAAKKWRWYVEVGSSSGGGGGGAPGVYGDASDGDLTFSKADNLQPISYGLEIASGFTPAPANYGRAVGEWFHFIDRRIIWCKNLTVDAGVILIPSWHLSICAIFVDEVLTLNGEISVSGDDYAYTYSLGLQNEIAGVPGGGFSGVGLGGPGGSGNGTNGRGNDGPQAGDSGKGGDGGAGAGGLGSSSFPSFQAYGPNQVGDPGGAAAPNGRQPGYRSFPMNLIGGSAGNIDASLGFGADGGGGGGEAPDGNHAARGGDGGPGGRRLIICARSVVGSGKLRAEGGRGQPGVRGDLGFGVAGTAGGGGAGCGGVVIVFSDDDIDAGITVSVADGTPGAGAGGGSAGDSTTGAAGYKRVYTKTRTYIP